MKDVCIPQFLIAAPSSGCGKTTVSRGLMALLVRKGMRVQPFKCGPDYIDTKFHTEVCGRPSVNLDTFMASAGHVEELYARYARTADVCVVEGMMGLYDGYDRDRGSSAEIARLLRLPVVLVVDAKAMAYSVAPLLAGYARFSPGVRIAGVIFNRVGSAAHYAMLKEACEEQGLTSLGYLPKREKLVQESRYLGLDYRNPAEAGVLDELVSLLEEHVDYKLLLKETEPQPAPPRLPRPEAGCTESALPSGNLRIAVARNDDSFSFIYEEHLTILRRLGTVTFFDPELDNSFSGEVDLLYLPGGYPEKHLALLESAVGVRQAIRRYAEAGGRVLAECGGMIYLSEGVVGEEERHALCGVLPFTVSARAKDRRMSLGYRRFEYNGQQLRGHEFHYTQISPETENLDMPSVAQVRNAKGIPVPTPVFRYKNVIASYTHLYWGEIDLLKLFEP